MLGRVRFWKVGDSLSLYCRGISGVVSRGEGGSLEGVCVSGRGGLGTFGESSGGIRMIVVMGLGVGRRMSGSGL